VSARDSHGLALFGVALIVFGVVYACMGESYERFHGWIYRSKQPWDFWESIVGYWFVGISCIVADVLDLPSDRYSVILFGCFLVGVYCLYRLLRSLIRGD
jgi:hypothetical protein